MEFPGTFNNLVNFQHLGDVQIINSEAFNSPFFFFFDSYNAWYFFYTSLFVFISMVEKFRERQGWADSNVGKWIVFPQRGYTGGLLLNSPKSFFSDTWADELLAYQSESSFQKQSHTSWHCQKTRRPMCSREAELCWWMTTLPSTQLVPWFSTDWNCIVIKSWLDKKNKGWEL